MDAGLGCDVGLMLWTMCVCVCAVDAGVVVMLGMVMLVMLVILMMLVMLVMFLAGDAFQR